MIKLYAWCTPNGYKPIILLEELGLDYELVPVNLGEGAQMRPEYLAINPNGKIPALTEVVDGEEIKVFESGAILIHLAERGGRFLPASGQARAEVLSWLMFQMAGIGPNFGQAHHFRNLDDPDPYAVKRFTREAARLAGILDRRLADRPYLGGDYSIADMAVWPWLRRPDFFGLDMDALPHLRDWHARIAERPAVQRALAIEFG